MNGRHAICLVIDGLRASALGCYGNTVSRTPEFDDLASRSAIVEWFWADTPSRNRFYQSAWQGAHSVRPAQQRQQLPPLHILLREDGVPLRLITDSPWLASWVPAAELENVAQLDGGAEAEAVGVGETAFAQFCSAAVEYLEMWLGDGAGSVTWIHAQGLCAAWDAPLELRAELLDEDDPEPLADLAPPSAVHVEDPDQLLLYRSAYAAQVSVIDACVGALREAITEIMADRETLLMITSSQGFALGEHGCIGTGCHGLFSERLHLPWLLYLCDDPGEPGPRPRIDGLSQPADIHATLLDWLGIEPSASGDGQSVLPQLEEGTQLPREVAYSMGDEGEQTIRTAEWLLRRSAEQPPQLFAKPDDRWEHNDVAVRCPEEVEQLTELASEVVECAENGKLLPSKLEASEG